MTSKIAENAGRIREAVKKAAIDAGRGSYEIRILAATKYTDRSGAEELVRSGITIIGENRVQDAMKKLGASDDGSQPDIHSVHPETEIHMIGHLQKNKVNQALGLFDSLDSLDSIILADALEKRLEARDRILPVLIEVKLTGEETKSGISQNEVPALIEHVFSDCPHISIRGVMGMGPWDPNPETARPFYRELKSIFDSLRKDIDKSCAFDTISMGMSADFQVAIQEGATMVRIGRALFE
ncbi:MAG: YggS family pyridoxal phosphate-dependent enzyme [bacterium]